MLASRPRMDLMANALVVTLTLAQPAPARSGPTMAREDTMHTEVPEVLVAAPRVTLDEILDRVARGEARRESLLTDQTFTATFRIVRGGTEKTEPALMVETIARVYKKRPDHVRSVLLKHWEDKPDKGESVEISFRPDMGERIVNFAFRPSARRDFRYHIVGRDVAGNHLIYRLAFEPRSPLDLSLPSGQVWIETNDFVIVRQEVSYERSPLPLFIKGIDHMVIERQRVQDFWVLKRVLMRARTTVPLPRLGRSFDISLLFDQYAINSGLDESLFVKASGRR